MTFLVAVNYTWSPCYSMGQSLPVRAGQPLRDGPVVQVGACDAGPLAFNLTEHGVLVTFGSGVIMDAEPPACTIPYANATEQSLSFVLPARFGDSFAFPTCSVMDSREGYHLTQYTLSALSWE